MRRQKSTQRERKRDKEIDRDREIVHCTVVRYDKCLENSFHMSGKDEMKNVEYGI